MSLTTHKKSQHLSVVEFLGKQEQAFLLLSLLKYKV